MASPLACRAIGAWFVVTALCGCRDTAELNSDVAPKAGAEPSAGRVQLDAATYRGTEGGAITVSVSRVGGDSGRVRVRYSTTDGSARAGADYVPLAGELEWKNGETGARSVTVELREDAEVEPDETIAFALSDPDRATLGDPVRAELVIGDNDAPPALTSYQRLTFEEDWEHTEPDVRINPADPRHALVTWMQKPAGGDLNECAAAATFDGGATWHKHVFAKFGHVACADISMAFAPFAVPEKGPTVYVSSIGYGAPGGVGDGDGASNYKPQAGLTGQIYFFRSDDGGRTWSATPTIVYDWADPRAPAAFDRPWIAVDHSRGPFRGRIYVSDMTVFVQQLTPRIYLKYSDDGGDTFSAPIEVDRTAGDAARSTPFSTLAVGADGDVMLVYRAWATGVADDDPANDGLADTLHQAGVPENPNGVGHAPERSGEGYCIACFSVATLRFQPESTNPDPDANFALMAAADRPYRIQWNMLPFTVTGAPRNSEENPTYATVAADPTTAGRYAAVFVESRYSKEAQADDYHHLPPGHTAVANPALDLDVSFTWTDDGGAHWSRPVRVSDDAIGSGVIQDRAWLAFDPVSGLPVAAWRDRRNALRAQGAGNGVMSDLYAARLESYGRRDWGDAPQAVSEPSSVNQRRYADAPRFHPNQRLSSPLDGRPGGGFTPKSSLSDSFFSIAVGNNGVVWSVWAPILVSKGNNTVPDEVVDLESGTRQIMLRTWDPRVPIDLAPVIPSGAP